VVVDRFVFAHHRLLQHDRTGSANHEVSSRFDYDRYGRQVGKTICNTAGAGDPSWTLSWRPPMVRHDHDFTSVDREQRIYATPSAKVHVFGNVVQTARFDGQVVSTDMRICNTFDNQGRRSERFQIYRMSDRPAAFDTTVHSYAYTAAGPRSMTASTLNVDRHDDGSRSVRFQMEWSARFAYDERGLVVAVHSGGSRTRNTYDARRRLIGHDGVTIGWERDRIVAITGLGPGHDVDFHYDAGGRLVDASYGPNQGYRVLYGSSCASDFAHPALAPNIDNFLHYEGKDPL
jgi:YD repeat-containing protein